MPNHRISPCIRSHSLIWYIHIGSMLRKRTNLLFLANVVSREDARNLIKKTSIFGHNECSKKEAFIQKDSQQKTEA